MPSLFPLFPTELIRSQLFSCSGVKFLSVPLNLPPPSPPAPSKITNTVFCSADYCDILIKNDLKGRSHCYPLNPHRSFTLFKQIHGGIVSVRPGRIQLLLHKGWIVIAWITGRGDILLSLYQQGYMVLKWNKRETWEWILNSSRFYKGFRVKR